MDGRIQGKKDMTGDKSGKRQRGSLPLFSAYEEKRAWEWERTTGTRSPDRMRKLREKDRLQKMKGGLDWPI
jgi:hypothetical protein